MKSVKGQYQQGKVLGPPCDCRSRWRGGEAEFVSLHSPAHRIGCRAELAGPVFGGGAASADTSADPLVFWLLVGQISCSAAVVPALTQHPVSTLSSWPYRPPCVDSITNTSAGQQIKWGSAHARPQSSTRIHNWACKLRVRARLCVCVRAWVFL